MSAVSGTRIVDSSTDTKPLLRSSWFVDALVVGSMIAAGAILILYLVFALNWLRLPFVGAMFTETLVVEDVKPFSGETWPAIEAGVVPGDTLVGVVPLGSEFGTDWSAETRLGAFHDALENLESGDDVQLSILPTDTDYDRMNCQGGLRGYITCNTAITLRTFPITDFALHFGVGYITALISFLVGLIVLWRRFDTRSAKMFAVSAAALSVVQAGRFDGMTTFALIPVWVGAGYLFSGLVVSLSLTFPYDLAFIRRAPMLRFAPLLISAFLAAGTVWIYETENAQWALLLPLVSVITASTWLVSVMWWRRQYSRSPIIREQVTFVGVGSALAFILVLAWVGHIVVTQGHIWHELTPVMQIAVLMYILNVAYAVLQYRLLETDRIIPESIVYGILAGLLLIGYFAITSGLSWLAIGTISADSPILVAVTLGIVVLAFNPVRTYLRDSIDRAMFRQRRRYQERAERFSRYLSDAVNMEGILHQVKKEFDETISPSHIFLFIYDEPSETYIPLPESGKSRPDTDIVFESESGLVRYFTEEQSTLYLEPGEPLPMTVTKDRSKLAVLGTPLLMRLPGRTRLHGFLAIGARRNGEAYTYEELRYIESIVDQTAISVERARFVDDLEQRVRIQDVLSQVSQALNFAIDFDTLLELIYNQTTRVIPADHFYIVSYDEQTDELYHSFYNLGEERLSYIERKRWQMRDDIVSDVITRQRSLRVKAFTQEQRRRNASYRTDGIPDIHAWMGVPLITDITGSGVLGVMAIGSSDPNVSFSDDQFQLFQNIASIAASAIDKTRLFQNTELRAAQLRALNEISSKLASELEDVESLLQRITDSAVGILGCEAGSLFLVDERTGDIEFRVVTGGGGQDLIGKRIARHEKSIVADAINHIQPVIVNNLAEDDRWHGEVQNDSNEDLPPRERGFKERAILTVPLVAQGTAVGALQVLNKTDGSGFSEEDSTLATIFADQAAIAIQNARMFQSQDQQLLARVQELENMAAIDHSLNQTVILDQLAEIVLNTALRQTHTTHGAIFLLTDDRKVLRLIGSIGYPEGSMFYVGAEEEKYLPVSTGILERVITSAAPSMVIDVKNDPHYVESLPNCKGQIVVPLASGAGASGAILVETDQANSLNVLDMDFLSRLAERATSSIANALLFSQLQEQQKARAEFVSFIAHELKTPITSMKGYTSLLMRGVVGSLTEQQSKFLNTVHSNIDHMEHLVNDIRDMEIIEANRQLSLTMTTVHFPDIVIETLGTVQQAFDDRGQIVLVNVPDDAPEIWADETRIKQIMMNFLTNANKYTRDGGKVEIFAGAADNEWDNKGARRVLHVYVKDNGLGISKEDQERLFEKYFRSTNDEALQQKGTGLGLTLTRRLIEQHGGRLWLESELGEGTTFHFTIPLASEILTESI